MDLLDGNINEPIKHWYYKHKFQFIHGLIRSEISTANLLVDVGAGTALFPLEMTKTSPKLKVIAVDTGYKFPKIVDVENRITYLQNGRGVSAEIYLFTDVLEHVPASAVDRVIADIFAYRKVWAYINIATHRSDHCLPDGTNKHVTVQDRDWWDLRLAAYDRYTVVYSK